MRIEMVELKLVYMEEVCSGLLEDSTLKKKNQHNETIKVSFRY